MPTPVMNRPLGGEPIFLDPMKTSSGTILDSCRDPFMPAKADLSKDSPNVIFQKLGEFGSKVMDNVRYSGPAFLMKTVGMLGALALTGLCMASIGTVAIPAVYLASLVADAAALTVMALTLGIIITVGNKGLEKIGDIYNEELPYQKVINETSKAKLRQAQHKKLEENLNQWEEGLNKLENQHREQITGQLRAITAQNIREIKIPEGAAYTMEEVRVALNKQCEEEIERALKKVADKNKDSRAEIERQRQELKHGEPEGNKIGEAEGGNEREKNLNQREKEIDILEQAINDEENQAKSMARGKLSIIYTKSLTANKGDSNTILQGHQQSSKKAMERIKKKYMPRREEIERQRQELAKLKNVEVHAEVEKNVNDMD